MMAQVCHDGCDHSTSLHQKKNKSNRTGPHGRKLRLSELFLWLDWGSSWKLLQSQVSQFHFHDPVSYFSKAL